MNYETWSDEAETRRRKLIDSEIAGTLTRAGRVELAHLDRLANEHFDRVAPPPEREAWFDYRLESDPRFLKRIEAARRSLDQGRGVRLEDLDE